MKFVKKSLCLLMFLMGLNCAANASGGPSAEERAQLITHWMKQRLELTNDQMPKVEALNLKYEKEIDQLTEEKQGFPCMQAVRDTLKKKEKELKELFTLKQFEAYCNCKCELKEELKRKIGKMN